MSLDEEATVGSLYRIAVAHGFVRARDALRLCVQGGAELPSTPHSSRLCHLPVHNGAVVEVTRIAPPPWSPERPPNSLCTAFSPSNERLFIGASNKVSIYSVDLALGVCEVEGTLECDEDVRGLSVTTLGTHLYTIGAGQLCCWGIEDRTLLTQARHNTPFLRLDSVISCGAMVYLTGSSPNQVVASFDTSTAQWTTPFEALCVTPSPGVVLTGHSSGVLKLWDNTMSRCRRSVKGVGPITRIVRSKGWLVVAHGEGAVSMVEEHSLVFVKTVRGGCGNGVLQNIFVVNSQLFLLVYSRALKIVNAALAVLSERRLSGLRLACISQCGKYLCILRQEQRPTVLRTTEMVSESPFCAAS